MSHRCPKIVIEGADNLVAKIRLIIFDPESDILFQRKLKMDVAVFLFFACLGGRTCADPMPLANVLEPNAAREVRFDDG